MLLLSHIFYQRDEVFEMGDITGDSLELARKCKADKNPWVIFCGVDLWDKV